jgi:hypothetical protein
LAGVGSHDPPKVHVRTLVLLGDIFELGTARLTTAAAAGRDFFWWLFQWLEADEIVYLPGNHDHVMWMWWKTCTKARRSWWEADAQDCKAELASAYQSLEARTSDPACPLNRASVPAAAPVPRARST